VSRFRFIAAERASHPVSTLCRVLGVSRSGFHAWAAREARDWRSPRFRSDQALLAWIRRIHSRSRATYGAPRVHAELRHEGQRCGRKRVARLMRADGLQGAHRRRRGRTTIRDRSAAPAPDLVERDFRPAGPDRLWVADITYVRTWSGWLYLAVVLDAFSRRVVGWAMRADLRAELVLEALDMALWSRRPPAGVIHHSDRGGQYTSLMLGRRCREAGIAQSMGSVGDCYDNALAESFFATLETELLERQAFATRHAARLALFDYIEAFYNTHRRHSSLGQLSPAEFERRHAAPTGTALTPAPSAAARRPSLNASSATSTSGESQTATDDGLAA
jgi:putative transposase